MITLHASYTERTPGNFEEMKDTVLEREVYTIST
jgi:hypothetical protein